MKIFGAGLSDSVTVDRSARMPWSDCGRRAIGGSERERGAPLRWALPLQ
jgi:hypothetical protein